MEKKHIVQSGECLFSIANENRLPVDRIKNHPDNKKLVQLRDASVLMMGDELTIPEPEQKEETGETAKRHRFRHVLDRTEIRIKISEFGEPRANEPYCVLVNNERIQGDSPTTDEEGLIVCQIPPDAKSVTILVGDDEDEYEISLGQIDPIENTTGLHGRLINLGLYPGGIESSYDQESEAAMSDLMGHKDEDNNSHNFRDPQNKELQKKLQEEYGS